MSPSSDYKNLKDLTKSLTNGINKLESGKLDPNELTSLLEDARTLHERITVLQYLAFEKEVKVKEVKKQKREPKKQQGSFELNFGAPEIIEETSIEDELDEDTPANQTNLLDAIEERPQAVVIVLSPPLMRMIVALCTFEPRSQENLSRRFCAVVCAGSGPKIIGRRTLKRASA